MRLVILGAGFAGMYAALSAARLRDIKGASPEEPLVGLGPNQSACSERAVALVSRPIRRTSPRCRRRTQYGLRSPHEKRGSRPIDLVGNEAQRSPAAGWFLLESSGERKSDRQRLDGMHVVVHDAVLTHCRRRDLCRKTEIVETVGFDE
jgi:hypothetical protein